MINHEMNTDFDSQSTIKELGVHNLSSIGFNDMLRVLEPFVLVTVPEGTSDNSNNKKRLDFLLGRLANLYAYVSYLWAFASHERARQKSISDSAAVDMLKKKEALHQILSAIKLKYEAVSRMITVALENEDTKIVEKPAYDARRDARDTRKGGGWSNIK